MNDSNLFELLELNRYYGGGSRRDTQPNKNIHVINYDFEESDIDDESDYSDSILSDETTSQSDDLEIHDRNFEEAEKEYENVSALIVPDDELDVTTLIEPSDELDVTTLIEPSDELDELPIIDTETE